MEWVKSFLNYLESDKGYSPLTVATYQSDLESFRRFFNRLDGTLAWDSIDADVVRRWMAERMGEGLNARTMRRGLTALRSFYRYQLMVGRVEVDPMLRVKNPKCVKPLPSFVKTQEMDSLLDRTKFAETPEGAQERLIVLMLYSTGVRLAELVGLCWKDVDLVAGEVKVTGKRNKQRIIPFGEELKAALEDCRRATEPENGEAPVFLNGKGKRITAPQAREIVKACLSRVTTQKKKTPHVLRHTFATAMLNSGAELEAVKQLLGHESLATTEVYTHTTFAELKKEYELAHPRA